MAAITLSDIHTHRDNIINTIIDTQSTPVPPLLFPKSVVLVLSFKLSSNYTILYNCTILYCTDVPKEMHLRGSSFAKKECNGSFPKFYRT